MAVSASISRDAERAARLRLERTEIRIDPIRKGIFDQTLDQGKVLKIATGSDLALKVDLASFIHTWPTSSQNIEAAKDALAREQDADVRLHLLEKGYEIFRGNGSQMLHIEGTMLSTGRHNKEVCGEIAAKTENEATMTMIIKLCSAQTQKHMFEENPLLNRDSTLRQRMLKLGGFLGRLRGK